MANLEEIAELFKALSDPTRLKIVKILAESPRPLCVKAITHRLEVSQPAVSQHLRILRQAGLAQGQRYGVHVHYSLNREALEQLRNGVHEELGEELVLV